MTGWPFSLKFGLGLFALGVGPLLLFIVADAVGLVRDPDPNPIGLGLIAFLTFWPAIGLIFFGALRLAWRALAK